MTDNLFDVFIDLIVLLPFILLVRAIIPKPIAFRLACIFVGTWLLYAYAPRFVLFALAFWIMVWALQYFARLGEDQEGKPLFWVILAPIIALPIAPMLTWKAFPIPFQDAFNEFFSITFGTILPSLSFADYIVPTLIPLGLSFLTFRALDLLIKMFLGILEPVSLDKILYYGLFPPILCVGPLADYEEVSRLPKRLNRLPDPGDIATGLFRIALGTLKIFLIAGLLNVLAGNLWQDGGASIPAKWAAMFVYGLYFYVNFSGYCEVAIGCARVLGIRLPENFNNPYMKTNPADFWNNWHITLTRWANRYVFTPVGGMRANRHYPAIFLTIMVIALWHGLTWPIFIFGILHGISLIGHRYLKMRRANVGLPPVVDTFATAWLKRFSIILFVSFTIPLLLLRSADAAQFYLGLIGL